MAVSLLASALYAGPPLYTGNDSCVITQYVVFTACRENTLKASADKRYRAVNICGAA
jgi:hypothetical protein